MDGLNEIIADNRANKYNGARIERENVEWVTWYVMQAMNRQHWKPMLDKQTAAGSSTRSMRSRGRKAARAAREPSTTIRFAGSRK